MEAEIAVGGDPYPALVFEPPFLLEVGKALFEEGIDVGMDFQA